jgi:hypothetical protein
MDPITEATREERTAGRRTGTTAKKRGANGDQEAGAGRFFLGKTGDNGAPALGREFSTEQEALIESLKTGQSYFVVSEWRAVADLSKDVPRIRRDAVKAMPGQGDPIGPAAQRAS